MPGGAGKPNGAIIKRTALIDSGGQTAIWIWPKLLRANGADVNRQGGNYHNGIDSCRAEQRAVRRIARRCIMRRGRGTRTLRKWFGFWLEGGADLHDVADDRAGIVVCGLRRRFGAGWTSPKLFLSHRARNVNARDMLEYATPFLNAVSMGSYGDIFGAEPCPHAAVGRFGRISTRPLDVNGVAERCSVCW